MECMKGGHDEKLSKQFISSWNNRKVFVGGIHFQINEEVITKVMGLSVEGRKYKKAS